MRATKSTINKGLTVRFTVGDTKRWETFKSKVGYFAFEGHTQAYLTPLGLGYWGTRIMEFTEIFSRYGKIGRFVIYE